ncbi:acyl-CoA dehydrogenase [Nocardioides allogilvus]|uniref:acyl-CoA dehydrogenase n=1 Tax=Nocardioides allogilvus TaxID=2072017 RepID=UPI000D2F5010|nr:acyl-CoA dehydrogenase [Nocardioides allogilvus]
MFYSLGISADHVELGASLRSWAASITPIDAVRAAEADPEAAFDDVWSALTSMSVPTIGLPEPSGGGGGSALDVAVALEACAYSLVPGHLLGTAIAAALLPSSFAPELVSGARVAVGVGDVVLDAAGADLFLLPTADGYVVSSSAVVTPGAPVLDLSRRVGTVSSASGTPVPLSGELLRRTLVTFAAAEAAGVARWCLDTAVGYAKVREQFGAKIGSFQAIKHLCAEMLETVTSIEAVAWDVASVAFGDDDEQWAFAADVAATVAFDGAVRVAQDCIQVLGGIGYTFEHDAHLYLRRALSLQALVGSSDRAAARVCDRATTGVRRRLEVDLDGRDASVRPSIRSLVGAVSPDHPREGLVSTGLLMAHWPAPYGLGADAVTQLVVDQELAAADITRPDLKIAGWAVPTILSHGTDEQRERFVRPSLLGEITWCQLFSEPGAGSDLASLRTRAVRDGSGWRLTGQKVWTSLAQEAQWAICLARTDPDAPQHKGITYFLVDMTSEGIDIRPLRELTGDALFNEVFLDDVFVPDELVVGAPGDGWKLARTTLSNERVAMAGHRLGVSVEGCVAAVGADPLDRVRVGRQVALATVCALLGVRTTLKALAGAASQGQGPGAESSVAKLLGVRNRQEASSLLVELLGPTVLLGGAEAEAAVHEMLVTRCLSIAGGTTQILRNVAAERVLGLPR